MIGVPFFSVRSGQNEVGIAHGEHVAVPRKRCARACSVRSPRRPAFFSKPCRGAAGGIFRLSVLAMRTLWDSEGHYQPRSRGVPGPKQ